MLARIQRDMEKRYSSYKFFSIMDCIKQFSVVYVIREKIDIYFFRLLQPYTFRGAFT